MVESYLELEASKGLCIETSRPEILLVWNPEHKNSKGIYLSFVNWPGCGLKLAILELLADCEPPEPPWRMKGILAKPRSLSLNATAKDSSPGDTDRQFTLQFLLRPGSHFRVNSYKSLWRFEAD